MPFSIFSDVALTAVAAVLPAGGVSLADELDYFDGDRERMERYRQAGGLGTRRIAPPGTTASDLCIQAARRLLEHTGTDKKEIGALFFVSLSPDYQLPASSAIQQHALGLSADCAVMDMNLGCAGFVSALWIAAGLTNSRACDKVLLLTGDTPAGFTDPANRVIAPIFGDSGTAALVEYRKGAADMSFLIGTDGGKFENLVIPGGGARIPQLREEGPDSPFNRIVKDAGGNPCTLGGYCRIWMDGMGIYAFAASVIPPHIRRHLSLAGTEAGGLDRLLLHPANKLLVDVIAKKTGFASNPPPCESLAEYGNLGGASIPALLCRHYTGKGRDEKREKCLLCGFGAGLAWSSCLLSLKDTLLLEPQDYAAPENTPNRNAYIAHWHKKFAG
ncbi:MAG: ketoacyl-ACP synthase III [Desulfovibrio sp.]|jgi:3-oxoacyl-[acyl-carrier-protein] synthase-3|nr:ketoacyl-ACP synthase III [Desulfovibrio sp.]